MNTANKLTVTRIFFAISIVVFYAMIFTGNYIDVAVKGITVAFILGSLTDVLDGYIARKYNQVTKIGQFLDPIADKLLTHTTLIIMITMLTRVPKNHILVIFVIILIARDKIVDFTRMVVSDNKVISANKLGKTKTLLQMVGVTLLTTTTWYKGTIAKWTPLMNYKVAVWLIGIATILSVVSGAIYVYKSRKFLINN